jgi:hypothetical protein
LKRHVSIRDVGQSLSIVGKGDVLARFPDRVDGLGDPRAPETARDLHVMAAQVPVGDRGIAVAIERDRRVRPDAADEVGDLDAVDPFRKDGRVRAEREDGGGKGRH